MFRRGHGAALALCVAASAASAAPQSWTLTNPTGKTYANEVVRLKIDLPASAKQGEYAVKANGKDVLGQIGEYEGRTWMYVVASLGKEEAIEYSVSRGKPAGGKPLVSLKSSGGVHELSNGRFAVQVPAAASGDRIPPPIIAVRGASGAWVGSGSWKTERKLKRFSSGVIGTGPIFTKVRLKYEFEGAAGLNGNVPAFAAVDVT
ncbi:hypothetical protein HQ560_02450, partial [bacterium]|nr:hypothetical protein [bacterium]